MTWSFDISEAPRGATVTEHRKTAKAEFDVEVFKPARVILATKCGKVVKSQWLPVDANEGRKVARWEMLHVGEEPVAWQPWPEHPGAAK
jgi:hypothetical protein